MCLSGPISLSIEGMGIEAVLSILPIQGDDGLASKRPWLLPLLAQHGKRRPSRLHFFQHHILELARKSNAIVCDNKVRHLACVCRRPTLPPPPFPPRGCVFGPHPYPLLFVLPHPLSLPALPASQSSAKQQQLNRQRVLQLWSLLPAFCANPSDVSAAFGE